MNDLEFVVDYRDGALLEIIGEGDDLYVVDFYDQETNILEFSETIKPGFWLRTEKRHYVKWQVVVRDLVGNVVFEDKFDPTDKKLLIDIHNVALGDTIAWVPYCEEFRIKTGCELTVQTNFYKLFQDIYPNITWGPLQAKSPQDYECYAYYLLYVGIDEESHKNGIKKINHYYKNNIPIKFIPNLTFHDRRFHKEAPFSIPLQKVMTNFLNLEFKELRPNLSFVDHKRPIEEKYVCISEFASSEGMKEWNNKVGWKTVVEELTKLGYTVVSISKEKSKLDGIVKRNGNYDLTDRVWYLQHCEFFIGLGSGLSWLAWAAGAKVVMIAGHSKPWVEFSENCVRIINEDVCNGCYNNPEHTDKFCCYHSTFCPENKNFICTRAISPKMVMTAIKQNNLI
jgi:hypothetical protein